MAELGARRWHLYVGFEESEHSDCPTHAPWPAAMKRAQELIVTPQNLSNELPACAFGMSPSPNHDVRST